MYEQQMKIGHGFTDELSWGHLFLGYQVNGWTLWYTPEVVQVGIWPRGPNELERMYV